ncbi:MAG: DUF4232 domain-containing protein [Streptosporangiaceae bacterium]
MNESRRKVAGQIGAVAICGVLLSACAGTPGGHGAISTGSEVISPSVPGTATPIVSSLGSGTASPSPLATDVSPSPPAAAGWPRCSPAQLTATFLSLGAATGHVGVEIVFRNSSARHCHLYGYPGLQLVSARGKALPTTVSRGGSFLFPAVTPHVVGLAPGQKASFDLAYADNPTGNPPPPYQQACPAAASLKIIPPGEVTAVTVRAKIAPCSGDLSVSPVVAGTAPVRFS